MGEVIQIDDFVRGKQIAAIATFLADTQFDEPFPCGLEAMTEACIKLARRMVDWSAEGDGQRARMVQAFTEWEHEVRCSR